MSTLSLIAVGSLEPDPRIALASALETVLRQEVRVLPGSLDPRVSLDARRAQLDSRKILGQLDDLLATGSGLSSSRVLAISDHDLFSSLFTHVFGEARLGGSVAVVSRYRLRTEHYGFASDPRILADRLLVESVHELGHLFGAVHCRRRDCVMSFSGSVEEIDLKGPRPCPDCCETLGLGRIDRVAQGA